MNKLFAILDRGGPCPGLCFALIALLLAPVAGLADDRPTEVAASVHPGKLPREALLFRNGDLLYGMLESITAEAQVRWRHADVAHVIDFKPENIAEIRFPHRPLAVTNGVHTCRLELSNGDELEGSLVSLDQQQAELQTWYAGSLVVPHRFIQTITPVSLEGSIVYEGPAGLEGWTIGKVVSALGDAGEWKYKNGAFYATNAASIARIVNLPDISKLEFDLAWKGVFQLAIALFTDYLHPINLANKDTEPAFMGFYSLQLNSFSANLLPVKKNDPIRYLGQISVPPFNQKTSAHVEIRSSKPRRSIALLVDGQLIKQWTDTEEFAGQGRGVRFVHQGQGKVRLSNLRISEWDGLNEEKSNPNPTGKLDIAKLRNGDKVTGQVESLRDGTLNIATAGTKLSIPLNRIRQIEFAGQRVERLGSTGTDARAVFHRGGGVSLRLDKSENGKVFGVSPAVGTVALDVQALSRLELNLRAEGR
ncbi:MAG: hypothetical protein U1G07_21155 [Verrucomicrobiota bacterium]